MENFDVDVVICWVDGNDPAWLEEKSRYDSSGFIAANVGVNRFRDWGWMKYWFRSIETYLPWVRKIHFVTWGHLPEGIDPDCEKLHIVTHRDFLPPDALPTYSSKALECGLARIDGLAEHFLYFNDDIFVERPMEKSDFFDRKTGYPKLFFEEMPLVFKLPDRDWCIMQANALALVNKHFPKKKVPLRAYPGRYISTRYPLHTNIRTLLLKLLYPKHYAGFANFHTVGIYRKQAFLELEEKEPEIVRKTIYTRFRRNEGLNQCAFLWWQLGSGKFKPGSVKTALFNLEEKTIEKVEKAILQPSADVICLEDPDYPIDFETCRDRVNAAFEKRLPAKCVFEI